MEKRPALLLDVARIFLKIGLMGFGGPLAAVGLMEEEVASRRGWVSARRFGEIVAVCKLLPGPLSTQTAILLGKDRAGPLGGVLAGICFVFPSFLIVLVLSMLYARYGVAAHAEFLFAGLQAGALVVILLSSWQLFTPYRRARWTWVIAVFSGVLVFLLPRWEPLVILSCGVLGARLAKPTSSDVPPPAPPSSTRFLPAIWTGGLLAVPSASVLGQLFWSCFKAGALVFGTGLAIVPVLEGDAVRHYQWLTQAEFLDGLAIGQITPGPVVITATFIGYQAAGLAGAIVATAGMFLPSFINTLLIVPRLLSGLAGKPWAEGFVRGAVSSVVGGILASSVRLGSYSLTQLASVLVFALTVGLALWKRPPSWALILFAGGAATLLHFVGC